MPFALGLEPQLTHSPTLCHLPASQGAGPIRPPHFNPSPPSTCDHCHLLLEAVTGYTGKGKSTFHCHPLPLTGAGHGCREGQSQAPDVTSQDRSWQQPSWSGLKVQQGVQQVTTMVSHPVWIQGSSMSQDRGCNPLGVSYLLRLGVASPWEGEINFLSLAEGLHFHLHWAQQILQPALALRVSGSLPKLLFPWLFLILQVPAPRSPNSDHPSLLLLSKVSQTCYLLSVFFISIIIICDNVFALLLVFCLSGMLSSTRAGCMSISFTVKFTFLSTIFMTMSGMQYIC